MSGSSDKAYAILVGINEYSLAGCDDLFGSLENVRLIKEFLSNIVKPTEMIVLTSPTNSSLGSIDVPDRQNLVRAFEATTKKATANDSIYIYFSGHGAQLPTAWPHLKPDNMDEALVLMPGNGYADCLRDVELAYILKNMTDKGASVTVLLDCCHSGGTTRSSRIVGEENHPPQMTSVSLDPKVLLQRDLLVPTSAIQGFWHPQAANQTRSAKLLSHWLTQAKGVEFFASCRESEVGWQIYHKTSYVGLFTLCLIEAATRHKNRLHQMSCDMVFKATRKEMERLSPQYLAGNDTQNITFGGEKLRLFLGASKIHPTDIRVTRIYEPEQGKTHAELDAGALHGISKGQGIAIYDQTITTLNILDYREPLAVCQLTEVEDWTSNGLIYQANGVSLYHDRSLAAGMQPVSIKCKAVQISTIMKDILQSSRTAMVGPDDDTSIIEKIKIELAHNLPLIQLSSSHAFFQIKVFSQDRAEISFNPNPQSTTQTVDIKVQLSELRSYLSHIVMYLNIVDLSASASSQQNLLVVEKLGILRGQSAPTDSHITAAHDHQSQTQNLITPFAQDKDPQEIQDRDWLALRIRNLSTETLYLEALYIEPSGCVSRISPREGEPLVELYPNASAPLYVQVQKVDQIAHNIRGVDFDSIAVLATRSEQCHFPEEVLPEIEQSKAELDPDDLVNESKLPTRGGGSGLLLAGGLVKQVNIRIV